MDEYEKHRECKNNILGGLYDRMDLDRSLYYLEPYIMPKLSGRRAKGVHNVTLNDPAVFANRAVSILSSAYQQVMVEGKGMKDNETTYIEDFLNAVLWEIDQDLFNRGIQPLYPWNCFHACLRGRLASRNLVLYDGKQIKIKVTPWDTRYVTYYYGKDGLSQIAYETKRTAADIESEYGISTNGTTEVVDIWTDKKNIVNIQSENIKGKPHNFGEVPGIYIKVPSGAMFSDLESEKHQGESIYSLNREMYNQRNKVASVLMTMNMLQFEPAMIYQAEGGPNAALPDDDPRSPGNLTAIGLAEKMNVLIPPDMRNATRYLLALLDAGIQRGSLANVDYGNLSFPLSAVAIAKLTETKDQIFVPRLQAIALYYQQLSKQIIRQYIKKGISAELGEEGHRRSFDPNKLKGNYTIKFRYFSQSPEQEIANFQVAASATPFYSMDTIVRDVLKNKDPEAEISRKKAEQAGQLDPSLMLYDYIRSLIYNEEYVRAEILKPAFFQLLENKQLNLQSGQQKPKQTLPLTNEQGGMRRPIPAGDTGEKEVREEENREGMLERNRTRREFEGE